MKALVIGATGLVGRELVQLLAEDQRFSRVIVFGRRPLQTAHSKIEEHLIDFENPAQWRHLVKGNVFFSTLGTTIKQAGSKEAQYKVDYTYQYEFAKAASDNHIPIYILVSAPSARPDSRIFYTKMKGELERDVKKLNFSLIQIIRPGLLHGIRKDVRMGEKLMYYVLNTINLFGILKQYRPFHGKTVANAMINAACSGSKGVHHYEPGEVFSLASSDSGQ